MGDVAGVAGVGDLRDRVDDVADEAEGLELEEGVDEGGVRVGDEGHIAFLDPLEAADGGAVEGRALGEALFVRLRAGVGSVVSTPSSLAILSLSPGDLASLVPASRLGQASYPGSYSRSSSVVTMRRRLITVRFAEGMVRVLRSVQGPARGASGPTAIGTTRKATMARDPELHGETPPAASGGRTAVRSERAELSEQLTAVLDPVMAGLGLAFLALLLIDVAGLDLGDRRPWLDSVLQVIWVIFLIEFGVRFAIAPEKGRFLRQNWFGAVSLALPFLRPLRALRAVRALRSLSLVRLLGGVNRGIRVLRRVTGGRQAAYLGTLTVFIVLAGAAGAVSFDRGLEGAPIQTFGDALWWATAMVTTINNELYAVSTEARVIAILMRLYAVSVFGLVTASIASYFIGRHNERTANRTEGEDVTGLHAEIIALRRDVAAFRRELAARRDGEIDRRPSDL